MGPNPEGSTILNFPIEIKKNNNPTQFFQVNWMLHDRCTYKCSYCAPSNYAGTDSWLDISKVIHTCDQIEEQVRLMYPSLRMKILLGGGEPTVWKDFKLLVNYLYSKNWAMHIVTNNSRSLNWWKSVEVNWDYLGISLHPEFVDLDSFIINCSYLINKSSILVIRTMLHPDINLFNKAIEYATIIKEKIPNIIIQWVPISYNFGGVNIELPDYSESQQITIKNLLSQPRKQLNHDYKIVTWDTGKSEIANANYLIALNMHNFKGWECYAGIEGIFIDSKGNINTGTCLEGNKIGHILDSKIELSKTPVICTKNSCTCVADVLYSKKRI